MRNLILVLVLAVLLLGCTAQPSPVNSTGSQNQKVTGAVIASSDSSQTESSASGEIKTFSFREGDACLENSKPVIRLFSTTWCPHCIWIKDTFDVVVKEYVVAGKIVAYHWELDTGDNTLTPEVETVVPDSETAVYREFNPKGSIPTFVFGCNYSRVGNGFESSKDLALEEKEFRAVIEELLKGN